MMIPRIIAKSAEAMFSRWAIKHVCRFLLKKKLGKFILGDLDLDQLDVQLGAGTIQLNDLALNVDYLNQKLGAAPVMIKEGSIGSLLVKFPWKVTNCQIEVEELELVLAPSVGKNLPASTGNFMSGQDGKQLVNNCSEKIEREMSHGNAGSVSLDVHEGVKAIAKMVKWLLTSFHVKIKNLIVAFDPCSKKDEERSESHRMLVLRITETEYGTCVSEDASSSSDSGVDSFLGMSTLSNFVNFKGAIIELLRMDDVDHLSQLPSASGTLLSEQYAGSSPSAVTPILTGGSGGFSGTVRLSMPWRNGSLDINKVDADVSIDPMELRFQPSTIKWIIYLWDILKNVGDDGRIHMHYKARYSDCLNSISQCQSSTLSSADIAAHRVNPINENIPSGLCHLASHGTATDDLLPGAHVITDWVPLSVNKNLKDGAEVEPDYGASIDQFFECFDGMRSSQATLGNSGMWNWTCSVFNAITAASSLASGSVHIPSEKQHIETNLKAAISGISVVLSFQDEHQKHACYLMGGPINIGDLNGIKSDNCSTNTTVFRPLKGLNTSSAMNALYSSMTVEQTTITDVHTSGQEVHYLEANCRDLVLSLQVFPKKLKFEAMMKHFEVDEYLNNGNKAFSLGPDYENDIRRQMLLVQHLQAEVLSALPPFPFSTQDPDSEGRVNVSGMTHVPLHIEYKDGNAWGINVETIPKDNLVRIKLLKSLGMQGCQVAVSSAHSDDNSQASTSFSVKLPPFNLWVNLYLVNALLNLFKQVGHSFEISNRGRDFRSEVIGDKDDSSCHRDMKRGTTCTSGTTNSQIGSLRGSIVLSHARIIFCFPFENHGDFRYSSWEEFICLDFSPSLSMETDVFAIPNANLQEYSNILSNSIHLNIGNLNIYLISSACKYALGNNSFLFEKRTFTAQKILTVTMGKNNHHSCISVLWQEGPVTGPWIARRAWCVATSQDSRSRNKVTGKGCEFASMAALQDLEANSRLRQETILSSTFFVHIHLPLVWIKLRSSEYQLLHSLLNQVMDGLSCVANGMEAALADHAKKNQVYPSDHNASQTSVLLECDVLDFRITLDKTLDAKCSIQKELPGSWSNLRLTIEKLELLSVSNIGGIGNASFVWVSHNEGELWGSIIGASDETPAVAKDILLISCKNSKMKRGDGEGANAFSSGSSGTSVIHLWDPESLQNFTSITVRCCTIVAPGGRLDWLNAICYFFSLPSHEDELAKSNSMQKGSSNYNEGYGSSLFVDFLDVALSYEPQTSKMVENGAMETECSSSAKLTEESGEQSVACLLAAASFSVSKKTRANSWANDYKIRLQDLGLLLCASFGSENVKGTYGVEWLHRTGYVKVAGVSLVEAILRTNCDNALLWELEFSDSLINLDTCSDTTAGLIRLSTQLQQLFAPDIEESIVHLQTRWNAVQQARDGLDISNAHDGHDINNAAEIYESGTVSPFSGQPSTRQLDSRSVVVGLMDEILEDVFYLNGNQTSTSDSCEMQSHISFDKDTLDDACKLNISTSTAGNVFPLNVSGNRSKSGIGLENIQASSEHNICFPELIEGYYISEILPLPQLSMSNRSLNSGLKCKLKNAARGNVESGKCGWYKDSSLRIVENHISKVSNQRGGKKLHKDGNVPSINCTIPAEACKTRGRIIIKNTDVRWRMYAGSDWPNLSKNAHLTPNTGGRDAAVCLELTLARMNLHYDLFPDGEICMSKLSLSIQDFHLYDNSQDAPWKMVLGYYHSKDRPRESYAKALKLDLEAVRPDPLTPLEEYRLSLVFLPILLHLDQDQLNFLINFFAYKDATTDQLANLPNDLGGSRMLPTGSSSFGGQAIEEEALLPFFQKCDIFPVLVRVDYNPRHINLASLRGGNYVELLNLVPWKGIELQLKHVHAIGVYGWSSICETIVGEWLEDISQNQVHKLLKGFAPIRPLFAVGSGAAKLISLPIKNYQKDHRLLKGVQRGAFAFFKSITLEAVGLGVHLASGAHDVLLQTEYILTSILPSVPLSVRSRVQTNVRSNQPKDAQQGIQQAYESLSDGLGKTASHLVGNPLKTYQRGGSATSALASAVCAAPAAAIAPASAAACAVHCALLGVRNSLDPEHKKESMEKYLGPTQPQDCRK